MIKVINNDKLIYYLIINTSYDDDMMRMYYVK